MDSQIEYIDLAYDSDVTTCDEDDEEVPLVIIKDKLSKKRILPPVVVADCPAQDTESDVASSGPDEPDEFDVSFLADLSRLSRLSTEDTLKKFRDDNNSPSQSYIEDISTEADGLSQVLNWKICMTPKTFLRRVGQCSGTQNRQLNPQTETPNATEVGKTTRTADAVETANVTVTADVAETADVTRTAAVAEAADANEEVVIPGTPQRHFENYESRLTEIPEDPLRPETPLRNYIVRMTSKSTPVGVVTPTRRLRSVELSETHKPERPNLVAAITRVRRSHPKLQTLKRQAEKSVIVPAPSSASRSQWFSAPSQPTPQKSTKVGTFRRSRPPGLTPQRLAETSAQHSSSKSQKQSLESTPMVPKRTYDNLMTKYFKLEKKFKKVNKLRKFEHRQLTLQNFHGRDGKGAITNDQQMTTLSRTVCAMFKDQTSLRQIIFSETDRSPLNPMNELQKKAIRDEVRSMKRDCDCLCFCKNDLVAVQPIPSIPPLWSQYSFTKTI